MEADRKFWKRKKDFWEN